MAVHQGIYASPMEVKPNRSLIKKASVNDKKIWLIEFDVRYSGRGVAVVKARNAGEAEALLKSQGTFNGSPQNYSITRIVEVIPSPNSMLLAEQIVTWGVEN